MQNSIFWLTLNYFLYLFARYQPSAYAFKASLSASNFSHLPDLNCNSTFERYWFTEQMRFDHQANYL